MFDVRKTAIIAFAAMSGVFLTSAANALPTLRLTQISPLILPAAGPASVTITDDGIGDGTPIPGSISFNGAVGNFDLNVATGVTKPILGSAQDPLLDLNSIDINFSNPGTIVIEFSETDFTTGSSSLQFRSVIGGTTVGTLRFQTFGSNSNTLFDQGILINDSGDISAGLVDFEEVSTAALTGTFSLTTVVTITHTGAPDNTSFNSILEIPEPYIAPPLILGTMLIGANLLARRRRR
ncbi:MAG: hypothetical protein ACPGRZ_00115 [Alphaproteobacteria bacterium]